MRLDVLFKLVQASTLVLLLSQQAALASAPRDQSGGDALRMAQHMLQALSAEKAALVSEVQQLTGELASIRKELDVVHARLKASEQSTAAARQRNEALVDRIRADGMRYAGLQERYSTDLGDTLADIQLLRSAVEERGLWINECQSKNEQLYQINSELLGAYREKDAWAAIKQREPLTGIFAVKLETQVQEYEFRLEDLRTVKYDAPDD
jgi:septal ring factor EnvC (AmiA/AmiB activator)